MLSYATAILSGERDAAIQLSLLPYLGEPRDNQTSGHISIFHIIFKSTQQTISFLQCNEKPDGFKRPTSPPRRHMEY